MPNACAIASCCWPTAACAVVARWRNCACASTCPTPAWRTLSMRSPESICAPLAPLLAKELCEIFSGRALWLLLLLVCPLIGYSFVQTASLYGEASTAGLQSPELAVSRSPHDGLLVPAFGALYVAVTAPFTFVAIRELREGRENGAPP